MIEAHDLVKRYGSTMAVNDLSFSIRPGLVTGFLGPNGAVHVRSPQAAGLAARCREAGAGVQAGTDPDVIEITGMDSAEAGRLAAAHGIALSELIPVRASLEEAFMELTRDSVEYQATGATR
jgi:ABC-2 type transport system ATP-binding protein